jgi:hypothetical protein
MLAAAIAIVIAAQWGLARSARRALREIDAAMFDERGPAGAVLAKNLVAGPLRWWRHL